MNKGLESFAKLQSLLKELITTITLDQALILGENIDIIETELKRLEEENKELNVKFGVMESIKIEQDEILRIIRENLQLKMSVDEDLGCLYVPLHNKNVCVVGYVEGKEKIDLLKGWLQ